MRLIVILVILVLPQLGWTAEACDVINAVERMEFAALRLANAGNFSRNSADAGLLSAHHKRVDQGQFHLLRERGGSDSDIIALQNFDTVVDSFNRAIATGRPDAAKAIASSRAFQDALNSVKSILPKFECNDTPARGQSGGEAAFTHQNTQPSSNKGFDITAAKPLILAVLGVIAASVPASYFFNKRQQVKRRRARRYPVHFSAQVKNGAAIVTAIVLDVSGNGVKIQIDDDSRLAETLAVLLEEKWRDAQIIWRNAHFCGLRFDRPLPSKTVQALRQPHRRRKPQRKTAP